MDLQDFKEGLAGSTAEGSSFARFFLNDTAIHYEIDKEQIMFEITSRCKTYVEDEEFKTGFVKVNIMSLAKYCNGSLIKFFQHYEEIFKENKTVPYIMPYKIKTDDLKPGRNLKESGKAMRYIFAFFKKVPLHHLKLNITTTITKSSTKSKWIIRNINNPQEISCEEEKAYLMKLNWQPLLTKEWANRSRNWPTIALIESELQVGYIIAKTSKEEK